MRLLWRFRLAILLAVVAGGALGLAYFRSLPAAYLGRSVVTLTLAPGTGPAAAQMARFQALAGDIAVIESALTAAGLTGLSPSTVRSVITTKVAQPGTLIMVETQWPDAEIAGRVSSAVARGALSALRKHWEKETSDSVAAREKDLADAEQQFHAARVAFADSWLNARPAIGWPESDPRRRELQVVLTEIPPTWARLNAAMARFAEIPPGASQPVDAAAVRTLMLEAEMRLAELESRRELLILSLTRLRPLDEVLEAWSDFDAKNRQLETDMSAARQKVGEFAKALKIARKTMSQTVGLEVVEPSFSPGRSIGRGANAFIARGMASGLVFSVFAVFFFNGLSVNFFGRSN